MQSSQLKKVLVSVGIIVGFLAVFGIFQTRYSFLVRTPVDANDATRHDFAIEEGSSASTIGHDLFEADLIRSKLAFKILVGKKNLETRFSAGTFVLRRDQSMEDIVQTLTDPTHGGEQWITTLEGWRAEEIASYLAEKGYATEAAFMECVETCEFEYDFLASKPAGQSLEGYLFPDTYIIATGATPEDIAAKMLDNFDQKLTSELRDAISEQGRTIHEIVTMASIIEREVRGERDRKIVSGILWKRLENNMGLGADATVLYALGDWKAPLTRDALQIDSPYNTRRFAGLPPGPIANPSLSSIEAAAYPEESEYWYYLTTLDTGEVKYGRTNDEHNENRARYL